MVNDSPTWKNYRADLTDEEVRGIEAMRAGIDLLFTADPDNHDRANRMLHGIVAERAEYNRIEATKPADDVPAPTGASAGPWEWFDYSRRWQRELVWRTWTAAEEIVVVDGTFYSDWNMAALRVKVTGIQLGDGSYTEKIVISDGFHHKELQPNQAAATVEALTKALELIAQIEVHR